MTEPEEPLDQLIERIRKFDAREIASIVAATERFSPERNQALLKARTEAHKQVPGWSQLLADIENAASRRFYEINPKGDALVRAVYWVGIQGATLATMAKPALSASEYRRLVKPVATVVDWLADESGVGIAPPPPEDSGNGEDETPEVEPASEETEMAVAMKAPKGKTNGKQAAQRKLAAQNVAGQKIAPKPAPKAEPVKSDEQHAQTEFFGQGKKEGVRVKPTRGGFSICVIGENHRVVTGHFASAELAKRAAEKNGLTVKKMPGQRGPVDGTPQPESSKSGVERAAEDAKSGVSAAKADKVANANGGKKKVAAK